MVLAAFCVVGSLSNIVAPRSIVEGYCIAFPRLRLAFDRHPVSLLSGEHSRKGWKVPDWALEKCAGALFKQLLTPGEVVSLLAGSLLVLPTYNHGAFLSLGAEMSDATRNIVSIYGVLAILVGLLTWLVRSPKLGRVEVTAIACILGGGISNLLDRCVYHGRVFDFLNLGIGHLRTGIFNVADVGIMLGVALLLLNSVKRRPTLPGSAAA